MNAKIIFAAAGLAAGFAGKLYVNHTLNKTMNNLIAKRLEKDSETVVLADVPEAQPSSANETASWKQTKPSTK